MSEFYTREMDEMDLPPARRAADYVRELGFDKAADYVSRHFDADAFEEGDVIPVSTRNQGLEGRDLKGVSFSRREVELADGLVLEGVFPEFEAIHHVELGEAARDMSLHQQFSACRADLQDHLYDIELPDDLTLGDMERMDAAQGYAPRGYTWNHNPDVGSFDLVPADVHRETAHTGGNALW